ncbi:MAG: 23S rRNA (guanosine(2251)-2'-O)-methyltransferase RlmB [Bacteroidales bacterium]|nr:23S rRNA (guanosine(2251)-2'-O)-methyltransferase RlmB [Bacteroidales bacterium]
MKDMNIYGIHPIEEALASGKNIDRIFVQKGLSSPMLNQLLSQLRQANVPMQFVPSEKLNKLTSGNHQGIVATLSNISYCHFADLLARWQEEETAPFVLALDRVTDVRNVGAIARTAECAGVSAIVIPDHGSAQLNDDAVKASSGALMRIPVCREGNLKTALNLAAQYGLQLVAATEKGAANYLDVDFRKPTVLVMGSEGTGVSPELLRLCGAKARLPIVGQTSSLNVSVAAAVFVYEMLRQRGAKP